MKLKKKVIKNRGKKSESTRVNSTNPPTTTWDPDKKKIDLQKKDQTKKGPS
jgi:hypothetical protein